MDEGRARRFRWVVIPLIVAPGLAYLLLLSGLIGFRYATYVDNQPLTHPVRVAAWLPVPLQNAVAMRLEDGRAFVVSGRDLNLAWQPDIEEVELVTDSAGRTEVFGRIQTPICCYHGGGMLLTIPIFRDRIALHHSAPIGTAVAAP